MHTMRSLHGVMGCKVVSRQCYRPSWCCLNVLITMCKMCKSLTSLRICTSRPQLASLALKLNTLPMHAHVCNTSHRRLQFVQSNWPMPLLCQETPLLSQATPLLCQTTPMLCQATPLLCQAMPLSVIKTCMFEVNCCPTPPNWDSSPFNM